MNTAKQLFAVCGLIVAACLTSDAQPFLYTNNYLGVQPYPAPISDIGMYRIDPSTGALTSIGPAFRGVGYHPQRMTVHPSGRFLYIGEYGQVRALAINSSTGALTGISTAPLPTAGEYSDHLAMHPSGRFLYSGTNINTPCASQNEIAMFTIDSMTGALTAGPSYKLQGTIAADIALDPSGKFLYYALRSGCSYTNFEILAFAIDASTGMLSPIVSGGLYQDDYSVADIVMHPGGSFLFVGATRRTYPFRISYYPGGIGSIAQISYPITTTTGIPASTIDPTGRFFYSVDNQNGAPKDLCLTTVDPYSAAMTPGPTYPIKPDAVPFSPAVDPTGRFLYVTGGNPNGIASFFGSVTGFRIDSSTGALSAVPGSPFTTDDGPYYLAITPSPFSSFTAKVSRMSWPVQILTLSSSFTTAGSQQPFNRNTQWMNLQVGSYLLTVPAGASTWTGGGWKYSGSVNGANVSLSLQWRGNGSYQLSLTAMGASAASGVTSPALVSVSLGANTGLATVSF